MDTASSLRQVNRDRGVDVARGLAIFSMFVAHTAPSGGPAGVFNLSEFLTFPLFALLVGVGAELGARARSRTAHVVRSVVAGVALIGLGWLLEQAGAHILIVLGPLGVLTLLMLLVVFLPTWAVAVVGAVAYAVASWTLTAGAETRLEMAMDGSPLLWWFTLLVHTSYPQAVLVALACVGVILARVLIPSGAASADASGTTRPAVPVRVTAGVAALAVMVAGLVLVLDALGRIEVIAYRTAPAELLLVTALAVGVLAVSLVAVALDGASALARFWQWTLSRVAQVGAMTMTIYALHICWLAWWVRVLYPGQRDDTWVNVIGMSVGAVVVAAAWGALHLRGAWSRGPLEGVVAQVALWLTPRQR